MVNIVAKYWAHQDEKKVAQIKKEHPEYIIALEFLAAADADSYVIFETIQDFETYKKETFTSMYSGWITLDFNMPNV